MSTTVDERVVGMHFDNKQFESGVKTSINSIDTLKKNLDFNKASKGLSSLQNAARNFNLSSIALGVDNISAKFTALGAIGITTLQNLTNSAVNMSKRFVSSLTLDPIKMGFNEYETKMGAIQTILTNTASKGTTLTQVTDVLDELNQYADKTIYNFAEMAKNVGTFTAAGIDVNLAAKSIKGIANLAAGSGSNAQQASTAMYQLSQAMASGTVKLMDWNSVVNAGMGGELFKNALTKTAKEMGVVVDASKPFRETLEQGWLTSEILTATLSKMADDESLLKAAQDVKTFTQLFSTMKESVQSGWAVTWENIIGDKNEATKTLTAINDAFNNLIGPAETARNNMTLFWKAFGGRDAVIAGITNVIKGLQRVLAPISEAFKEIFPPITGIKLVRMSEAFLALTEKFKMGDETLAKIKSTFKGFFALLDIGRQAFVAIVNAVMPFIKSLFPMGDSILGVTASFGDYLVGLNEMIRTTDFFGKAFAKIGNFLTPVIDALKAGFAYISGVFASFGDIDMSGLDTFSDRVNKRFGPFVKFFDFIGTIFKGIVAEVKKVFPIIGKMAAIAGEGIGQLRDGITKSLETFDFNALLDVFNAGIFSLILVGIKKFIASLTSITDGGKGMLDGIKGILDGVKGSLEAYQTSLKAGTLMQIAGAIAILAASLVVLSLIDPIKLTVALGAITVLFAELTASMAILTKVMGPKGFVGLNKTTAALISLSVAVLILSVAMKTLADLSWEDTIKGLGTIALLSATLVTVAKSIDKNTKQLFMGAAGLVVFAFAIRALVDVVKELGALDAATLTKGLVGVGVLIAELGLFAKFASVNQMGIGQGLGLLALAAGVLVLANAVKMFADMNPGALLQGLGAVTMVMLQLTIFSKALGGAGKIVATAVGLTILGGALLIFAQVIGQLGGMDTGELIQGGIALAAGLGIIAGAMFLMKTALPGAAALLVVSAALAILAPVLMLLGSMSWESIGKGLVALAGAFAVIGIAALVLTPIIPSILGLAAAIALLGVGLLAIGGGVLLFATGLSALAVAGTGAAAAITVIVTAIIGLIPLALRKLGEGIVALAVVLGDAAPELVKAIVKLVGALIDALIAIIPKVVDGIMVLLMKLSSTLLQYVPQLVEDGMELIIGILTGLATHIRDVVKIAIKIVTEFINGVIDMIPEVIQAGVNLILAFINGTANAIRNNADPMVKAIRNLISATIEAGGKAIVGFADMGKDMVDGFINGLRSKIKEAADWAGELASSVLDSAKQVLGIASPSYEFDQIGQYSGMGLGNGIRSSTQGAVDAAAEMGQKVVDAVRKPIDNWDSRAVFEAMKNGQRDIPGVTTPFRDTSMWDNQYTRNVEKLGNKVGETLSDSVGTGVTDAKPKLTASTGGITKTVKTAFEESLAYIEDRKYYNTMSLNTELAAWERVQKRYKQGSDERRKADREIYRLKNEIASADMTYSKGVLAVQNDTKEKRLQLEKDYYDATKSINDRLVQDIQAVTDEYNNAVRERSDALYNARGLFDEVAKAEPVSGIKLLANLQSQIIEFKTWQIRLESLAGKGLSSGLISELEAMGPQSVEQIKALDSLSAAELTNYASMWEEKHKLAKKQSVQELEGLRVESINKISLLKSDAVTELELYRESWAIQLKALTTESTSQLDVLKAEWLGKIGTLRTETEKEFATLGTNVTAEIKKPNWAELGVGVVDGMISGIKTEAVNLATASAKMATDALEAAKFAIGAHSPSVEFAKLGMYADQGFALGLNNFTSVVKTSAVGVGNVAISALQSTISRISDMVNGSLDVTPTIRPVLDLTNIENGGKQLNSIFGSKGLNVSASQLKVASISAPGRTAVGTNDVASTNNTDNSKIQMVNHFSVRNDNDIRTISNKLGNIIDRYNNAKGVVAL